MQGRRSVPAGRLTKPEARLVSWGKRRGTREGTRGVLLEGDKLVREALVENHPLEAVWFTAGFAESGEELLAELRRRVGIVRRVSEVEMRRISDLETPPGVAAVGPEPGFIHRRPGDRFSLIVAVSILQDPGNLGGLVRTADYFGVGELWLGSGSTDPYSPKALRGSMGAAFRLPVIRVADLCERIRRFKDGGTEVWAAAAHGGEAEREIAPAGSRILLIGGESRGLLEEELALANHRVTIPGAGRSESLNLTVAAGILIHAATTGRWSGG